MSRWLVVLFNLGITDSLSVSDQRRIRLINTFAFISFIIGLIFCIINFVFGFKGQALLIFGGLLCISVPPLYFNNRKKYTIARHLFTIVSTSVVAIASFNAIRLGELRFNEIFMVGFAAFIVVVFENPFKLIYFSYCALLTMGMVTSRRLLFDLPIESGTFVAYTNIIISFACVYFFTSLYKQDLIKSNNQLKSTGMELEKKKTEVMRQRDELDTSKQLLRAAIDSLPVFIALLDMKGFYLIANSKYEQVFGLPVAEIEGKDFRDVLPKGILDTHINFVLQGLRGKEVEFEEHTDLPNGQQIEVLGRYIPVYNKQNKQFALAVYVVDITKLKQAEAKLVALNNTKNRLLSLISHDLKGPLHSLSGLISVANEIHEDEIKTFIDKISKKLSVVNFSLDNLLNWAKAQMDGFNIRPEKVNLQHLVNQSIQLFEEKLKNKNIHLSMQNKPIPSDAWVDRESVNLVLRNIISNAIKFSPEDGKVHIDFTESNGFVKLSIVDQGMGIKDSEIEQITTGAQSVKSTTGTAGEEGTGLGLSLSLEIMNKNKGGLHLSRGENDSGTKVVLDFPKARVDNTISANK